MIQPAKVKTGKDIFEELGELEQWYYDHAKNNVNIHKLLSVQDRMAILSVNLAVIAGELKDEYNGLHYIRKVYLDRRKQAYMADGDSAVKATTKAGVDLKNEYKKEIDAESLAYKIDIYLKQINKVLQAIQQRISFLKMEYDRQSYVPQN